MTEPARDVEGVEFRAVVFNAAKDNNLHRLRIFLDGRDELFLNACLNVRDGATDKIALVVASRYGHLDVVRYLLQKGADPSIKGTVSFDGETIYGAPALWAAAAAGHLDVTRCLVEEAHVDINQTTQTNSSPLRGACYDGHLDIVRFLVESGADIELANRHGHTPLMIAAFRKKVDVVAFLLERKADPTRVSLKGNTALHDAAEADCREVCLLLLKHGAQLVRDDSGVCPLLASAMLANHNVFDVLLEDCLDDTRRRDALKMLGCTLVDKKMDLNGALVAWTRAIEEHSKLPASYQLEMEKPKTELASVYENYTEAWDFAALEAMASNPDAIRIQALLVRERILGGAHSDVHYFLRLRGAVYCDMGEMAKCFDLWKYACSLQQTHLPPLHGATVGTLQAFQETFAIAVNDVLIEGQAPGAHARGAPTAIPITMQHVISVHERVCFELERLHAWGDRPLHEDCCMEDHSEEIEEEKTRIVLVGLQLIILSQRLHQLQYQLGLKRDPAELDVARLVRAAERVGLHPLHLACQQAESTSTNRPLEDFRFPSLVCVDQLVSAGADVNAKDSSGNSPLHVVLANDRPRTSIVKRLLEAGGYLYARNGEGRTVLEVLAQRLPSAFRELRIGSFVTLFGLAAVAVRRLDLPFPELLPLDIHAIVAKY